MYKKSRKKFFGLKNCSGSHKKLLILAQQKEL